MSVSGPRLAGLIALLVAIVLILWQCTGSFDRSAQGEPLSVFGPWIGDEAEAFVEVLEEFTSDTGIEIDYTGSSDFDGDLRRRIGGGLGLPDVAVIPQPALVAELAAQGVLIPLGDDTVDAVVDNFEVTRDQLTLLDDVYLAPYRNNVKSLVWFRPDVFDENGWQIPTTLDELGQLVDEIADTEIAPWCFTISAGAVTGWAATDWVEDLVLRRAGPDAYDEWVTGVRPFDDQQITAAFEEFDTLVLGAGHVLGGVQRVVSTDVSEASGPLFESPAGCAMYKQGSFATNWFPEDAEIGPDADVDFFVLPGVEANATPPMLAGGDGLVRLSDSDEGDQLLTYLASPAGAEPWIDGGGYLANRTTIDLDAYDELDRRFVELLIDGRPVRFDASDSMLSDVREVLLDEITTFVAEANYVRREDDLAGLVDAVDTTFAELLDRGSAAGSAADE